jgi:hypothetical protein
LLAGYEIEFDWNEKDRVTAIDSWNKYVNLTASEKTAIGVQMIDLVKDDLENTVLRILNDSIEREIDGVSIELHSNIGEVKTYQFPTIQAAVDFLNFEELKQVFITTDSLTLFDPSPNPDSD